MVVGLPVRTYKFVCRLDAAMNPHQNGTYLVIEKGKMGHRKLLEFGFHFS